MDGRFARAALVALVLATVLGWTSIRGLGPLLAAMLAGAAFLLLFVLVRWLLGRADELRLRLRESLGPDEGQHHAFAGVTLRVHDDGRYVWIDAPGLQRVLGLKEGDDVTAARTPGHWRRDERGLMWLRVDAVVGYLGSMGGRDDPRVQKLRRYLERDVIYPAEQRRRRA